MALPTRGEAARLHIFRSDQRQDSGTARRTGSIKKSYQNATAVPGILGKMNAEQLERAQDLAGRFDFFL